MSARRLKKPVFLLKLLREKSYNVGFNVMMFLILSYRFMFDKTLCLLHHLTGAYSFNNEPSRLAKDLSEESLIWIRDYNKIITFTYMVQDYAYEAKLHIEHAKNLNDGNN